jgi:hypothetical protein
VEKIFRSVEEIGASLIAMRGVQLSPNGGTVERVRRQIAGLAPVRAFL